MEKQLPDARARANRLMASGESARVAWWLVQSAALKAERPTVKPISMLLGDALPEGESPIEVLLADAMRCSIVLAGRFVLQHAVPPYRFDIAIPAVKLGIECDGQAFHREPAQMKRDQRRDRFLTRLGWRVVRFTGTEIRASAVNCAARVARYYEVLKAL